MKNTRWFYSQLFYVSHVIEESRMSYSKRRNLENPLKSKNVLYSETFGTQIEKI